MSARVQKIFKVISKVMAIIAIIALVLMDYYLVRATVKNVNSNSFGLTYSEVASIIILVAAVILVAAFITAIILSYSLNSKTLGAKGIIRSAFKDWLLPCIIISIQLVIVILCGSMCSPEQVNFAIGIESIYGIVAIIVVTIAKLPVDSLKMIKEKMKSNRD